MTSTNLPVLILKRNEDRRLSAGHLWVYSNEVDTRQTPLSGFEPGSMVVIQSAAGKTLGAGYVNPHSLICARLLASCNKSGTVMYFSSDTNVCKSASVSPHHGARNTDNHATLSAVCNRQRVNASRSCITGRCASDSISTARNPIPAAFSCLIIYLEFRMQASRLRFIVV